MNLLVIPSTVGVMVLSREIVVLLFGRGAFTPEAIDLTASALFYYSVGMTAFGLKDVLIRAFYALQDTKTPIMNATIAVIINIVLNIVLSRFLGIGGLALATSIAGIVSTFLMFITLRKKIGPFGLREAVISFVKISAASLVMGGIAYATFLFLCSCLSKNTALIASIGIGTVTYGILILLMKIPEVDRTVAAVKLRIRDRKRSRDEN
ncbi:MAG: hypothetical protein GX249_12320 [Firmicutes bacterium]|nr:hypothetical protein [Bacillota bacterium]